MMGSERKVKREAKGGYGLIFEVFHILPLVSNKRLTVLYRLVSWLTQIPRYELLQEFHL